MQTDFEKKVQERLEELNLTPSAPVWQKIESQLTPEKKRRRGLLWLFFGVLIVSVGGIYYLASPGSQSLNSNTSSVPSITVNSAKPQTTEPVGTNTATNQTSLATAKSDQPNLNTPTQTTQNKESKSISFKPFAARHNSISFVSKSRSLSGNETVISPTDKADKSTTQAEEVQAIARKRKEEIGHSKIPLTVEAGKNSLPSTMPDTLITAKKKEIETIKPSPDSLTQAKPIVPTDSSTKKKIATTKKWQKEIVVLTGWSQNASGFSSTYLPNNSTSYPNNPGTGFVTQSDFTKGFSFSIGVGFSKQLSKQFWFAFGLQYAYYSLHNKVGSFKPIDSLFLANTANGSYGNYNGGNLGTSTRFDSKDLNGYYDQSQSADYTTFFHVLEVPLRVDYRPFTTFPLQVSAGISYGHLLKSNALTFTPTGLQFFNKQNNNSNYVNLLAGFQFAFLQKHNFKLAIGPQIQYNLVLLQKPEAARKAHLLTTGLKTILSF